MLAIIHVLWKKGKREKGKGVSNVYKQLYFACSRLASNSTADSMGGGGGGGGGVGGV